MNPKYQFLHVSQKDNSLTAKVSCLGYKTPVNMFNSRKSQWLLPMAMDSFSLQK